MKTIYTIAFALLFSLLLVAQSDASYSIPYQSNGDTHLLRITPELMDQHGNGFNPEKIIDDEGMPITLSTEDEDITPVVVPVAPTTYATAKVVSSSSNPIIAYIGQMAAKYGVSATTLTRVAKCESNFRTTVYGDKGKAYGLFQFWKATFLRWEKESGMNLEYTNWRDQTELAAWAFSKGYSRAWTCR